jgi:hypothetical protein
MRSAVQWIAVVAGASFIGWTHAHTDEIPVVLGFALILSAVLGGIFPRRPWLTGFFLGAPVFLVELLVHFSVVRAPYPPSAGIPWAALTALVPAMGGAFFGSAIRHLQKGQDAAG